jgi:hypothetical protein
MNQTRPGALARFDSSFILPPSSFSGGALDRNGRKIGLQTAAIDQKGMHVT